jgi:hypothetical protein
VLGLKHGINELADYDPGWSRSFTEEQARLHSAIGDATLSTVVTAAATRPRAQSSDVEED